MEIKIREESELLRHILANSSCNMSEEKLHGAIVLIDSSWVSVSSEQYAVWQRLLAELGDE